MLEGENNHRQTSIVGFLKPNHEDGNTTINTIKKPKLPKKW